MLFDSPSLGVNPKVLLQAPFYILVSLLVHTFFKRLFNPLNRFPGPRLAKWTRYYMGYYDAYKGGAWIEQLRELHRIYGPVVRVAPNELHFSDPQAYADIYSSTSKFPKDPALYRAFSGGQSLFTQTEPQEVASRKPLIAPFFSKQRVLELEGTIQNVINKLTHQLLSNHSPSQTPANLNLALRSTTFDIITTYCFAKSINAVTFPHFHNDVLVAMDTALPSIPVGKHFRVVKYVSENINNKALAWLKPLLIKDPVFKCLVGQLEDVERMVERIMREHDHNHNHNSDSDSVEKENEGFSHRTIFHSLLEGTKNSDSNGKRPSRPITKQWLADEGAVLRFAGSDTVSSACVIGCRYLLANKEVLNTLVKELKEAWPDKNEEVRFEVLEKLPYLSGVIKESLRLSHGTTSPLTRIVTTPQGDGAMIAGHFVPEGTSVAITNSFVHLNPDIFAEPEQFKPERWLQPDSIQLEKYLVAFGKGPRSCIGINLAWCELYLIMGNIFRKLDLKPTMDVSSPYRARDCFVPLYDEDLLQVVVEERD